MGATAVVAMDAREGHKEITEWFCGKMVGHADRMQMPLCLEHLKMHGSEDQQAHANDILEDMARTDSHQFQSVKVRNKASMHQAFCEGPNPEGTGTERCENWIARQVYRAAGANDAKKDSDLGQKNKHADDMETADKKGFIGTYSKPTRSKTVVENELGVKLEVGSVSEEEHLLMYKWFCEPKWNLVKAPCVLSQLIDATNRKYKLQEYRSTERHRKRYISESEEMLIGWCDDRSDNAASTICIAWKGRRVGLKASDLIQVKVDPTGRAAL